MTAEPTPTAPGERAMAADRAHLPELLRATCERAIDALRSIDARPVAGVVPGAPAIEPLGLPESGIGAAGALDAFGARYAPHLSGSAGPRYFAFVTGGATPAALAGDWLTSTYDQNAADAGESSARALALDALGMVRALLGLPPAFGGAFVTGATASATVALATARQWLGRARGLDPAHDGLAALGPAAVLSGTAHASVSKALAILGLGRGALRPVATLPDREAVDPDALAAALEEVERRGEGPAIVVANAGTVNTCDFDDLRAIAALRARHRFWLHVDGAFGAIAAASARLRSLVAGLEEADSITVDAHKWLNVPYDGAVVLTRHLPLQGEVYRNAAAYLPVDVRPDTFVHLTPENSQRLRALPVWMTLAAYGRDGYAALVERTCDHAAWIGDRLAGDPRFRLLAPVRLNGVCFALAGPDGAARPAADVARFLDALARGGTAFATPTSYRGTAAARLSITSWRTTRDDMEQTWQALQRAAGAV